MGVIGSRIIDMDATWSAIQTTMVCLMVGGFLAFMWYRFITEILEEKAEKKRVEQELRRRAAEAHRRQELNAAQNRIRWERLQAMHQAEEQQQLQMRLAAQAQQAQVQMQNIAAQQGLGAIVQHNGNDQFFGIDAQAAQQAQHAQVQLNFEMVQRAMHQLVVGIDEPQQVLFEDDDIEDHDEDEAMPEWTHQGTPIEEYMGGTRNNKEDDWSGYSKWYKEKVKK